MFFAIPRTAPMPATWLEWEPWGDCSATCGTSERARARKCSEQDPEACNPADATETESCPENICPGTYIMRSDNQCFICTLKSHYNTGSIKYCNLHSSSVKQQVTCAGFFEAGPREKFVLLYLKRTTLGVMMKANEERLKSPSNNCALSNSTAFFP